MTDPGELRLPAVEVQQTKRAVLYSFAIDGKLLPEVAAVSRVRRDADSELEGYQRPEVLSHIREIQAYLESPGPMIPNALVIAFDSRVRFEPSEGSNGGYSRHGSLVIPVGSDGSRHDVPGWIVDGQQRAAAIRNAKVSSFPICVTAFITDDVEKQRSQFILVNSTKPLPKGLVYELLPFTDGHLPTALSRRQFPSEIMQRLNLEEDSIFYRKIKTPTNPEGLIKDNSVLRMIENSLTDGALYRFSEWGNPSVDPDSMLDLLNNYWRAVGEVFPEAWGRKPRRSRLMHGVGIVSMGFLMDAVADRLDPTDIPTLDQFREDLLPLQEICKWTNGFWDFGAGVQRKWNELQNLPRDIQLLSNYLLWEYKQRVWDQSA